jgi:hypothetical protein
MPNSFPCPNPTCTQVFSPQEVRGVASLTCPKCGHVFRFAPGAAPPPPPAPRPAPKRAPAPPAPPVPVARPVPPEPEPEEFVPPPERPKRRGSKAVPARGKRRRSSRRWVVPVVVCLLMAGAATALLVYQKRLLKEDDGTGGVQSPALNFAFRAPGGPWQPDPDAARRLGAVFAMGRHDPNSWFAVVARDYKDRMPRDDEMLREAVARLRQLFSKGAEWEQRDEDSFAGLPAQRIVFTAENSNNVPVSGECLMAASGGIGYWFFGWTPSAVSDPSVLADVQEEWARVREGFTLLREREGWVGKAVEVVEVEGKKADYHLKYAKGLWERDDNPDDADLLLLGRDPEHPKDARKRAWVRVFVRPASDDPEAALKEAQAYVEGREKKLYPEVKLEAAPEATKGGLADGPVELGQAPGQVVRLRVKKGDDYEYFFALAAVPRPTFTLVLVGECTWAQREAWENRFGPIFHSLQFEKPEGAVARP